MDIKRFTKLQGISSSILEAIKSVSKEELKGSQHKIDKNKNGKIDAHDFKLLRKEEVKDKTDIGEYDQEGDMAKSDLRSIISNAKRVHDMLKDDDNLPEWVQSKITKAEDYISTVANYMESEMNEGYVSHAQRKAVWASRNDAKKAKKEGVDESDAAYAASIEKQKENRLTAGDRDKLRKTREMMSKEKTELARRKAEQVHTKTFASEAAEPKDYPGKDGHTWTPTGKTATHSATGKKTYEYAEVDKEGKKTGARHYKDIKGKHMGEERDLPFTPDKPKKNPGAVAGKHGIGPSVAKHLAKMAMQKQIQKQNKDKK